MAFHTDHSWLQIRAENVSSVKRPFFPLGRPSSQKVARQDRHIAWGTQWCVLPDTYYLTKDKSKPSLAAVKIIHKFYFKGKYLQREKRKEKTITSIPEILSRRKFLPLVIHMTPYSWPEEHSLLGLLRNLLLQSVHRKNEHAAFGDEPWWPIKTSRLLMLAENRGTRQKGTEGSENGRLTSVGSPGPALSTVALAGLFWGS